MKFKKGDIVEVIKDDKWQGIDYPVGTQLRVCENQGRDSVVHIYDSMQKQGGCAKLWEWNLKLVKREEEEKELKVKIGDKVFGKDVVNQSYYTGRIIEINHNLDDWASYCIDTVYGNKWLINDTITKVEEEKPKLDLNNLTTTELREYVELVEAKEEAEFLLECFIEKVTK